MIASECDSQLPSPIPCSRSQLNVEELEANFAANARKGDASGKDDKETSGKEHAASKEGGAVPGTPRKAEIVNLVDPKTANNTAIALSRFRRTAEDLANALLVGEEMPTEQISALLAILPSAEDAELVQVRDHAQIASRMALEIASPKALLTPRLRSSCAGVRWRQGDAGEGRAVLPRDCQGAALQRTHEGATGS